MDVIIRLQASMAVTIMKNEQNEPKTVIEVTKDEKANEGNFEASPSQEETSEMPKEDVQLKEELCEETNESKTKSGKEPWPLRDIKEPHENDVLYGRGGGTNHHPGNKRYRKMVEKRKLEYINSKRLDKPNVALKIIEEWRSQDPPGRFLKQDDSTGLWHDVGPKKAREKTSQALREKAPQIKQETREKQELDGYQRSSMSDPENFHSQHGRVSSRGRSVAFSKGPHDDIQPKRKLKPAVFQREHSLGHDIVKPGGFSLDNFSWHKPVEQAPSTGVSREHSLALNPLNYTNVSEPFERDYFVQDEDLKFDQNERSVDRFYRSYSGSQSNYRSDERRSAFSPSNNNEHSRHKRSSSFENPATDVDYQTNIFQSWSHGQQDEYVQQNQNTFSSWEQQGHGRNSGQMRGYEGVEPGPPRMRSTSTRSASSNNSYSANVHPSDYNYQKPSKPYQFEKNLNTSHGNNQRNTYYPPGPSFDNNQPPHSHGSSYRSSPNHQSHMGQPMQSSSSSSNSHYERENRSSTPHRHDSNPKNMPTDTYRPPYQQIIPDSRVAQPYPYAVEGHKSNRHVHAPPLATEQTDQFPFPNPHHVENISNRKVRHSSRSSDYNHDRNHQSNSRLARPSTIKRNTSNQNEQADTKKETKLIKRPGLNREHSITAARLREDYQKKVSPSKERRHELDNHRSLFREHSLAANKLTDSNVIDPIPKDIFSNASDVNESSSEPLLFNDSDLNENVISENIAALDDDIRNISHATKEIDLGTSSKKLEKPSTLKPVNRMSTIEIMDELGVLADLE